MTIIAVERLTKNSFIMVSDRRISSDNWEVTINPVPKTRKVGNTLIGGCGNATEMLYVLNMKELESLDYVPDPYQYIWDTLVPRIQKQFRKHFIQEEIEQEKEETKSNYMAGFLICTQNKIFALDLKTKGIELFEVSPFVAVGSGQPYAMAAYRALRRIYTGKQDIQQCMCMALETVAQCTVSCDDNIDVIKGGGYIV